MDLLQSLTTTIKPISLESQPTGATAAGGELFEKMLPVSVERSQQLMEGSQFSGLFHSPAELVEWFTEPLSPLAFPLVAGGERPLPTLLSPQHIASGLALQERSEMTEVAAKVKLDAGNALSPGDGPPVPPAIEPVALSYGLTFVPVKGQSPQASAEPNVLAKPAGVVHQPSVANNSVSTEHQEQRPLTVQEAYQERRPPKSAANRQTQNASARLSLREKSLSRTVETPAMLPQSKRGESTRMAPPVKPAAVSGQTWRTASEPSLTRVEAVLLPNIAAPQRGNAAESLLVAPAPRTKVLSPVISSAPMKQDGRPTPSILVAAQAEQEGGGGLFLSTSAERSKTYLVNGTPAAWNATAVWNAPKTLQAASRQNSDSRTPGTMLLGGTAGVVTNIQTAAALPEIALPTGTTLENTATTLGPDVQELPSDFSNRITHPHISKPQQPGSNGENDLLNAASQNTPLNARAWSKDTSQRIAAMITRSLNSAEIHIDPPELGPISVRLQMHQDQLTVQFVSPHGQVREFIEQHMNQLERMLEERGLNLGDADVSTGGEGNSDAERGMDSPSPIIDEEEQNGAGKLTDSRQLDSGDNAIDTFI